MELVDHARAEREVVGELHAVPVEVVVVELPPVAGRSPAHVYAVLDVAVAVDQRLHERVVDGIARDRHRDREPPQRVEAVDVEPRAGRGRGHDVGDVIGPALRQVREVGVPGGEEALRADHPRAVGGEDLEPRLVARARGRGGVRQELRPRLDALRVAIAGVQQHRLRGSEGELAEALVARAVVRRELAVEVGLVGLGQRRPVVGAVEVEAVLQDRAAEAGVQPVAVLLVAGLDAGVELRSHALGLELVAELAVELGGARLADRVHREAAGAIEVDGPRPALEHGHLGDVVGGRLGGERPVLRQAHVDAVEVVDVVLAAAAGARTADRVLGVLHAGDQLLEVPVLLRERQAHDLVVRQRGRDRRGVLVDHRGLGGHRDRLADAHPQHHVDERLLCELDHRLARHGLHARERELERVGARRQRRQHVLAVGRGHGLARPRQHVGARLYGRAGQHRAVRGRDLAADRTGLLGVKRRGRRHEEKKEEGEPSAGARAHRRHGDLRG